ncbi:hypothetical protein V6N12_072601 [Hibiscus sabdariffa]|uniref:Uncharacterized protein n=1 Tax=Hibiscus sabdariffa TaxID=183260 RepID=A0ABR2BJJ7_9ROSI
MPRVKASPLSFYSVSKLKRQSLINLNHCFQFQTPSSFQLLSDFLAKDSCSRNNLQLKQLSSRFEFLINKVHG